MMRMALLPSWMRRPLRWTLSKLAGSNVEAFTVGYTIVFLVDDPPMDLVVHEMIHVEQAKRMGRLRFWASYLWETLRHGYRNNKYEVEARRHAGQEE